MKKINKWLYYFNIKSNYGQGFETVTAADTWKEARALAKDYRDNERYPVKITKARMINPEWQTAKAIDYLSNGRDEEAKI